MTINSLQLTVNKNKESIVNCQLSIVQRGFTLIELLVTISIISILATVGIAAFVSYSRIQILNAATSDLFTTLQIARSRAASQVKPFPQCSGTQVLEGYKVVLCGLSGSAPCTQDNSIGNYELDVVCSGTAIRIVSKTLPPAVSFNASSTPSIFFYPLKGGTNGGTITIGFTPSGLISDKVIIVYNDGRITLN